MCLTCPLLEGEGLCTFPWTFLLFRALNRKVWSVSSRAEQATTADIRMRTSAPGGYGLANCCAVGQAAEKGCSNHEHSTWKSMQRITTCG